MFWIHHLGGKACVGKRQERGECILQHVPKSLVPTNLGGQRVHGRGRLQANDGKRGLCHSTCDGQMLFLSSDKPKLLHGPGNHPVGHSNRAQRHLLIIPGT